MWRSFPSRCAIAAIAVSFVAAPSASAQPDLPAPTVDDVIAPVQETLGGAADTVEGALENPRGAVEQKVPPPAGGSDGGGGDGSPGTGAGTAAADGGAANQTGGGAGGGSRGDRDAGAGGDRGGSGRSDSARGGGRERAGGDGPTGAPAGRESQPSEGRGGDGESEDGILTRTVREIDEVVPGPIKLLIAALALLAVGFAGRSLMLGSRARRLVRQREQLRRDVGLLQEALLPEVPALVGQLAASVAYRPAEGPAAGGDFYDVFELLDGRVAVIVGDVSGHGHAALSRSASMRYRLHAYVEAGLGPREALRVAEQTLGEPGDAGDFTTVVVAIHDPKAATLTYAMAGHPPPVLLGSGRHEPVIVGASPPVGAGFGTGQRQTTVTLAEGSLACFFTDGLIEARNRGGLLGQSRLTELVQELGGGTDAQALLDRVLQEADQAHDDMAACVIRALSGRADPVRVEELEVEPTDVGAPAIEHFLAACGVSEAEIATATRAARRKAVELGAAIVRVTITSEERHVEVAAPSPRHRLADRPGPVPADLLAAS